MKKFLPGLYNMQPTMKHRAGGWTKVGVANVDSGWDAPVFSGMKPSYNDQEFQMAWKSHPPLSPYLEAKVARGSNSRFS